MNTKKQRREAAQKKAKKRRVTIMAASAACLVVAIIVTFVYVSTRPNSRVFAIDGGQSVALYENGRFVARLFHNANISGTFVEEENESITTISFTHGGNTVFTHIEDDVLTLPIPWRAACRLHSHEIEFPLVQ